MEIEIEDVERGEVVATVSDASGLETDDELAAGTIPVADDGTVDWLYAEPVEEDGGGMATASTKLAPGDAGYLYAVVDALPHPFAPADDYDLDPPDAGGGGGDGPDEKGRFPNLPSFLSGSR